MNLKKLTLNELKKQHLSVLREIGRVVGVKSPASKNKTDLINLIRLIQSGKLQPEPPNKCGAPPKIKIDLSEFILYADDGKNINVDDKIFDITFSDNPSAEKIENTANRESDPADYYKPYPAYDEKDSLITFSDGSNAGFELEGILDLHPSGYGFIRTENYDSSRNDAYVSPANIKKFNLRKGDKIKARVKSTGDGGSPAVQEIYLINEMDPKVYKSRDAFDTLLPYYPTERIKLENDDNAGDISIRCIDMFAPLGKGQRGLIVAPPKTGKTTLLKKVAQAIEKNYPDVHLMILLIDERPEEVTDMKRSVNCDVLFSTFDERAEHHIKVAEIAINRAKRLVEVGQDVVILMDSITRLARAYNNATESSGKTLSGGVDPVALLSAKRFFGAARNIEDGGSLTILSTALVETGSRMDDVIYEEFKGTGNMEIHLSRELSEKRIFPAIDIYKSGTRKEDLLLNEVELNASYKLRKMLKEDSNSTDTLIEMMNKSKDNLDLTSKLDTWLKISRGK